MNRAVHGHEVLEMIASGAQAPSDRQSLIAAIESRFGADARYHTCSAEALTATELVKFLLSRGKVVVAEDGLRTDPEQICGDP